MILQNGRKEGELLRTGQYIYIHIKISTKKLCIGICVYKEQSIKTNNVLYKSSAFTSFLRYFSST